MADSPFAGMSGTVWFGEGENRQEIAVEDFDFKPTITLTRGDWWPPPKAGYLHGGISFESTIHGSLDEWSAFRDWRCPGCGILWVEVEPGHSWSSARGHCWTETGPIDEYGRPTGEADSD